MDEKNNNQSDVNSEEVINLVIARLKTIPDNAQLSIGSDREPLPAKDLIEEVKNQTETGKKIIESQLYFLRSLQNLPVA